MKKTIVILLALVMTLSLAACGGGASTAANMPSPTVAPASPTPTEAPTPSPAETEAPESKEKTIGDITIVDNFECQIMEVNWYSASDFNPAFLEPEEGFEYIVVVLSEKNTTNDTENAPALNLLSADGKECLNKAGLSLYKNQYKINFGATLAGSTAEAYFIYQIPTGAKSFKFQILSNGFGSSSDYIVFDRDDIQ